jgi:hypothetical protein
MGKHQRVSTGCAKQTPYKTVGGPARCRELERKAARRRYIQCRHRLTTKPSAANMSKDSLSTEHLPRTNICHPAVRGRLIQQPHRPSLILTSIITSEKMRRKYLQRGGKVRLQDGGDQVDCCPCSGLKKLFHKEPRL